MNKNTEIISELKSFQSIDDNSRAVTAIVNTMERIRIDERQMGVEKNANCKMTCAQTLQLMMLFPFFTLKNAGNYVGSVLEKLFGCSTTSSVTSNALSLMRSSAASSVMCPGSLSN
jgi:hypothetical protein